MASNFFSGKRIFILLHLAGWILVFTLPLYFVNSEWFGYSSFLGRYYALAIIYGLIFYVNYFMLVPRFFLKKKYLIYSISAIALIFILVHVEGSMARYFFERGPIEEELGELLRQFNEAHNFSGPPFRREFHIFNFTFTAILISGFALGLRIVERYTKQEKQQEELAKVNLKTELAFLKNQVSPHFFFNTLNNIYALIDINTSNAQEAVLRLSKLMRYLLYESDQTKVKLSEELEFMLNYIELMNLRLSSKVDLEISFPELETDFQIPPFLFIPFLENAYKHGVSYTNPCFINISLKILNNTILFECSNSIVNEEKDDKLFSGIGLENVQKRLDLLFPGNYELNIDQDNKKYKVDLKINIID